MDIKKAFTLIELLVVVAIIALLVAILIPTLQTARALAEEAACASNLKQIGYGLRMYADDNYGFAPTDRTSWNFGLLPYLMKDKVDDPDGYGEILGYGWFACPTDADPTDYVDYPDNWQPEKGFYGMYYPVVSTTGSNLHFKSTPLDKVSRGTLAVGDSSEWFIWCPAPPYGWQFDYDADDDGKLDTNALLYDGGNQPWQKYNLFRPLRHPNGGNALIVDGHIRSVTLDEWITGEDGIWGEWVP